MAKNKFEKLKITILNKNIDILRKKNKVQYYKSLI